MNLKHLTFKNRLVLYFIALAVPLTVISASFLYVQIRKILGTGIEKELQHNAQVLTHLIRASADISIQNRLQGIAEKNLEIAEYYYSKYRSGLITWKEAVSTIEETFLNQSIGISGYIYCLNSKGDLIIHPDDTFKGTNIHHLAFARKQIALKDGYLEYSTGPRERLKAVFMVYSKPLDWIISASSFRDEFSYLVDVGLFKKAVLSFNSGHDGYAFILNESGKALIHPEVQGKNLLSQPGYSHLIQQILDTKSGKLNYTFTNAGMPSPSENLVIFTHLPEYKWIIGATTDIQKAYAPLNTFLTLLTVGITIMVAVLILLAVLGSKAITRPLDRLAAALDEGAKGNYIIRLDKDPKDALGQIAGHFNKFMDQLETYHKQLNQEIQKTVDTQTALVNNELKLRGLFNYSFQFTCILSPFGVLEEINKSLLEFAGCTEAQVLYRPFHELPWWQQDELHMAPVRDAVHLARQGRASRFETTHINHAGEIRNVDISVKPIFNNASHIEFIITESRDITALKQGEKERRKLAVQLEKSQKMEAIGTLAGGIAHDFNNILSSIFGYAQLAQMAIDTPAKALQHIDQIEKGAQRATDLVQQILTFSRQGKAYAKKPLKLHLVLNEALKLLRSSIPATIEISTRINAKDMITADPTQMHQVIMNLCTNAFHAMQESGGTMTVALDTVNQPAPGHCSAHPFYNMGPFLRLLVQDTGHGMDKNTLKKAFDPYFTTKEIGRGTGFGLALVQAIIDDHKGMIHAESKLGAGSSFNIYLPVVTRDNDDPDASEFPLRMPEGGKETIMIVDDEPDLRHYIQEILEKFGYTVFAYEDGKKALAAFIESPDKFDIVVTDMTMPMMTGLVLARKIASINPQVPVILCSGYNETLNEKIMNSQAVTMFLQKPFNNRKFLRQIREILDN